MNKKIGITQKRTPNHNDLNPDKKFIKIDSLVVLLLNTNIFFKFLVFLSL